MSIFKNGVDEGYLEGNSMWWFATGEHQYRIAKLDEDYPEEYFKNDHLNADHVQAYCDAVEATFMEMAGRKIKTIVEFGPAGGWFMLEFWKRGIIVIAFEGSSFGIQKCLDRGISGGILYQQDIRKPLPHSLHGKAYMVLATEILEHVELPFHGTAVHNLVKASDIVWFSSEEPNTNKSHLHHPGEMPLSYWQKLFDFYGYGCQMIDDDTYNATAQRARCVFYNRETYPLNK